MDYTPGGIAGKTGETVKVAVAIAGTPPGAGPKGEGPKGEGPAGAKPSGKPPAKPAAKAAGQQDAPPPPADGTAAAPEPAAAKADPPEAGEYGDCVPKGKELHPLRRKAIALGLSQEGLVNDLPGPEKKGWERMMEYWEIGFPIAGPAKEERVRKSGKRPFEWCGVFCTWALIKAGLTDKGWRHAGKDGLIASFKIRSDLANVVPGDVAILDKFWHHFLVTARSGDEITYVQGNGFNNQITVTKRPLKGKGKDGNSIQGYYRVHEESYV